MAQDDEKILETQSNVVADNTEQGGAAAETAGNDSGAADNNDAGTVSKSSTTTETLQSGPTIGSDESIGHMEQLARDTYPQETPQERKALDREAKRKNFWTSLNDSISALSNLYFTSQYAPNSFDPSDLGSDKVRERYDKLRKDRDENRDKWYNAVLQGRAQDQTARQFYEKMKNDNEQARLKREQEQGQFKATMDFKEKQLAYQKDADDANRELEKQKLGETARHNKAAEAVARLNASLKGEGSNGRYPYYWVNNGRVELMFAPSEKEQQRKIDFAAQNYGDYGIGAEEVIYSKGVDAHGNPTSQTVSRAATYKDPNQEQ